MKKNSFTKIITIIILAIAAFSLVFWSFIMILSPNTEENQGQDINNEEIIDEIEVSGDEEWIEISADDNIVTIEWDTDEIVNEDIENQTEEEPENMEE